MTEYDFQRVQCDKCNKIRFCVQTKLRWLCQTCHQWSVEYAGTKDRVNQIMIDCGIEDLEK